MRNIILITFDSLRADHCSFMGYNRETTPTIDKMARGGLYFENAIASGPGTPTSMTGVFTGEYDHVGGNETSSSPWRRQINHRNTLSEILSGRGYTTGAFNPNPFASSFYGFNKGFHFFQDFLFQEKNGIFGNAYTKLVRSKENGLPQGINNVICLIRREGIFKPWESYYGDIVNWVKNVEKPFFLWVLLLDTHYPYMSPREFRKWGNIFDIYLYNWKNQSADFYPSFSEAERARYMATYDDSILYADAFVERLLEDLNPFDPIYVVHADHGEGFGEHDFYGHPQMLYEELIHVPLVIYNSDIKGKVNDPVSLRGLSSTILNLIDEKNCFQPESFLKEGKDWVISKSVNNKDEKIAVRTKKWKFISGKRDKDELYYLKEDPHEQENLVFEHPKLVDGMREIVKSHVRHEIGKRRLYEKFSKIKVL